MFGIIFRVFFVHRKVLFLWLFAIMIGSIWILLERTYNIGKYRAFSQSVAKLSAIIPWSTMDKTDRRETTAVNLSRLNLRRKTCKLPKLNPFDENVRIRIPNYGPLECKGKLYSKIENNKLIINAEGANLMKVVYNPIERPSGDDFNFKLGKSEVILSSHMPTDKTSVLATGYQGCVQHASGKCMHPYGGGDSPKDGTPVVLHSDCCMTRIHFVLEGHGVIRHKVSGKCLQPESEYKGADGSTHALERNTALVFSSSCDSATGTFQVTEKGSLQHIPSNLCVQAADDHSEPQNDEKLVLRKQCDTKGLAFYMYTAPVMDKNIILTRPISSDFGQVEILHGNGIDKEFHLNAVPKSHVQTRPINRKGLGLNVIALMFDSTSAANWQRMMRKSNSYLRTHLKAINFKGHSIVGDGTTAQLCAMFTGIAEEDQPEARRSMVGSKPVDDWNWIFRDYKNHGYATLYTEDDPELATFNFRLEGFSSPPTDHYARNFWLALQEHNNNNDQSSFCIGPQAIHNLTLGYVESFMEAYPNRPKFAFALFSSLSHADQSSISYSDEDLLRFLKRLEKRGHLNNTLFITFGDHGPRFSDIRETIQGKLEERLPHFSVVLPAWFKKTYANLFQQLKHNSEVLTSHFDTYATLKHILTYPQYPGGIKTGASLFRKINPKTRTCVDAGIPSHWCPCMQWENFDIHQRVVMDIAQAVIGAMNNLTSRGNSALHCERLQLKKVNSVLREMPSDEVQRFEKTEAVEKCDSCEPVFGRKRDDKSFKDNLYQIQLITKPGDGVFEASVRVWNGIVFVNEKHISRINKYGHQPDCIKHTHTHLMKYCYCKNHKQKQWA